MKYLEGGSTEAAEQGASDPISSGVDDDDAEGRATMGGGASERSDEPWDLRLLLGASDPISSGEGIEKNPLLCL